MPDHVLVRMYDVGFGDSFLLEFPVDGSRSFRVLVDCGAHTSGYPRDGWRPEDAVDQIVADLAVADDEGLLPDPRIDVVIATHRHQDHVSGFRAAAWSRVSVGEVWMPWTEHPTDAEAARIRNRQSRLALGLQRELQLRAALSDDDPVMSLVTNALTNEAAMRTLHSGFKGRPQRRFLSADTNPQIRPLECPGLTVHVLGPSRDEAVIRDMDPPAGGSYLRFAGADSASAAKRPFGREFTFDESLLPPEWAHLALVDTDGAKIKQSARSMLADDEFAVAVSLDKAVNGTSLMLMFEFGNAFLLFPGDAQWGTWRAALDHDQHRELLSQTTFLKVGHHGSHNATPREFLESALKDRKIWGAATSVHPVAQWGEIPKDKLLDQLVKSSERVRRSDQPGDSGNGVQVREGVGIDFFVPFA